MPYLTLNDSELIGVVERQRAQLVTLSVGDVQRGLWPKPQLHYPLIRRVYPLATHHFVY